MEQHTNHQEKPRPLSDVVDYEKIAAETEAALIQQIIDAREQRGWSQRKLAEMSGLKQSAVARLESMNATPQISTILKLLKPLGYTLRLVQKDR